MRTSRRRRRPARPDRALARAFVLAAALALTGCASFHVADSTPLPESKLEPIGAEYISRGGYRIDALRVSPDAPDLVVLVAFSGGGKRSASFGYGALKGMRRFLDAYPAAPAPARIRSAARQP